MIETRNVFEAGSDEWRRITLGSPAGIAVVGALALAIRSGDGRNPTVVIRTLGDHAYCRTVKGIGLEPGLLVLGSTDQVSVDGIRGTMGQVIAIPFGAVGSIEFEEPFVPDGAPIEEGIGD